MIKCNNCPTIIEIRDYLNYAGVCKECFIRFEIKSSNKKGGGFYAIEPEEENKEDEEQYRNQR